MYICYSEGCAILFLVLIFNRAADWKLDQPNWTGRVRVCAKGKECYIKIEDKNTGEYIRIPLGFSWLILITLKLQVFLQVHQG